MKAVGYQARKERSIVPHVGGEEHHPAARPQHARKLAIHRAGVGQVLEDAARHDHVHAGVSERQCGQIDVVGFDAIRHVGEFDQLDADQPLHPAEILAQHRHRATAAGVQQHARTAVDDGIHLALEQAVRVRHIAIETIEQPV